MQGEQLTSYGDDDYLVFDCPGQIELYNHLSTFRTFVDFLKRDGWSVCAVYCIDCHFVTGEAAQLETCVARRVRPINLLNQMNKRCILQLRP